MRNVGLSLVLALGILGGSVSALLAEELSLDQVVVALKPDKDPDRMLAERGELARILEKNFGKPVEVIVPTSAAVIVEGMRNGTIDLAYVSSTEMVNARDNEAGELLLAGEIDGNPYYKSYWLALKDAPYSKVEDLKGKPIAFSSRTSTSGFLIPMVDLHAKGLIDESADPESFFGDGNVSYGIGYVSAVERVLSGEAEAAAVSYYVFDEDEYLTAEQKAKLKKVTEQGPVPTHVIAVSSKLDEADRAILKDGLLALRDSGTEINEDIFSAELIEVDADEHLAPVEAAMKMLNQR
ncbi:MAG: phosphate/phosphite/phosphonate ABC transporter substrate-binding protein [Chthoniobacterales bacterium]